jgi:hypothetical protein
MKIKYNITKREIKIANKFFKSEKAEKMLKAIQKVKGVK